MRAFRILLALAASGGFGAWLVRTPHDLDEVLIACGGWVLGFWAAASLLGFPSRAEREADESFDDDDAEDDDAEDDLDDGDWDDGDWDDEQ